MSAGQQNDVDLPLRKLTPRQRIKSVAPINFTQEALDALAAGFNSTAQWLGEHEDMALEEEEDEIEVEAVVVVDEEEREEIRARKQRNAATLRRQGHIKRAIFSSIVTFFLVAVSAMFCVSICYIYWTPIWTPLKHMDQLKFGIVNKDKGFATTTTTLNWGTAVVSALKSSGYFGMHMLNENTTREHAQELVRKNKYWSILYIPSDFTTTWAYAVLGGVGGKNGSYTNTMYYIQDSTKQYTTSVYYAKYVQAVVNVVIKTVMKYQVVGTFSPKNTTPIAARISPIALTTISVRDNTHYGWAYVMYMSFLFIFIGSLISSITFLMGINCQDKFRWSFWQAVGLRYLGQLVSIVAMAGAQAGVLNGLGLPHAHNFGSIWGMYMLIGWSFAGITNFLWAWIGPAGIFCSIILFYVQVVVCDGLYAVELFSMSWQNAAKVLPMPHAANLLRYLSFDTLPDDVGVHVGALIIWSVVGNALAIISFKYGVGDPRMKLLKRQ